ncbi:MAG: hypothetical protein DMG15_29140 [Acidobacteria bacterium]|nr:MAG: hypothetical protein DMG16_15975 [Acidobacteriota bacterium]PYS07804.1 MAG: hypothetical protein DMG15_29140 [Acidobacteriota bacterium]
MTADNTAICEIAGGHFLRLRAIALALRGLPLQWPFSTFCAKPMTRISTGAFVAVNASPISRAF